MSFPEAGRRSYVMGPNGEVLNPGRDGGMVQAPPEFVAFLTRYRTEQEAVGDAEAEGVKVDHGYEDIE